MESSEDQVCGLRRLTIANEFISISILPQLGGKLISLKHKLSAKEWLHLNPHFQLQPPVYGGAYVHDFDSGGWDECCPSISPELHTDTRAAIPDHGELWCLPWECSATTTEYSAVINAWVRSPHFPFEFHRDVTLQRNSSTVEIEYTLRNLGSQEFKYLWSAHPILNIEEGMRISIQDAAQVRLNGDANVISGAWPLLDDGARLDQVPAKEAGIARKLFVGPLSQGIVSVQTASGELLKFTFDTEEIQYVGLWQNFGGWSGNDAYPSYYNMGVEPCSGMPDSLRVAGTWRTAKVVNAYGEVKWRLKVELTKLQG